MLHRRIYQFVVVYFLSLAFLFLVKYMLHVSDYVVPSPRELLQTGHSVFARYLLGVLDTLAVAIVGHILSIFMATVVGIIGIYINLPISHSRSDD